MLLPYQLQDNARIVGERPSDVCALTNALENDDTRPELAMVKPDYVPGHLWLKLSHEQKRWLSAAETIADSPRAPSSLVACASAELCLDCVLHGVHLHDLCSLKPAEVDDAKEASSRRSAAMNMVRACNPVAFEQNDAIDAEATYRAIAAQGREALEAIVPSERDGTAEVKRFKAALLAMGRARPVFVPCLSRVKASRVRCLPVYCGEPRALELRWYCMAGRLHTAHMRAHTMWNRQRCSYRGTKAAEQSGTSKPGHSSRHRTSAAARGSARARTMATALTCSSASSTSTGAASRASSASSAWSATRTAPPSLATKPPSLAVRSCPSA